MHEADYPGILSAYIYVMILLNPDIVEASYTHPVGLPDYEVQLQAMYEGDLCLSVRERRRIQSLYEGL